MSAKVEYVDAIFTPAEAEKITGVSHTLQRDWRRRGFLASFEGWARFTSTDLAHMLVIQSLSAHGIGPSVSSPYARTIAQRLAAWCLTIREAWSGELEEAFGSADVPPVREFSVLTTGPLRRFVMVSNTGFVTSADDLTRTFDAIDDNPWLSAVVLDLQAMGRELVHRAGRPLVYVNVEQPE
jgi:hypothetical protein